MDINYIEGNIDQTLHKVEHTSILKNSVPIVKQTETKICK